VLHFSQQKEIIFNPKIKFESALLKGTSKLGQMKKWTSIIIQRECGFKILVDIFMHKNLLREIVML